MPIVQVGVPQFSVPPQPSLIVPQLTPWAAQVVGVQEEAQETESPQMLGQLLF